MRMELTAPAAPASAEKWTIADHVLLLILVTITISLRVVFTDPAPSFDELWHLGLSRGQGSPLSIYAWDVVHRDVPSLTSLKQSGPIRAIWRDELGVLHPPLYMIVLRLWREVAGDSDRAAHLLSSLLAAGGIVFTYATAKLSMNRVAAVLCGLALACGQTQVYLGQEIRGYAQVIFLASIAVWIMTRIEVLGPTRRRAMTLALCSLLLVLTHYFTLGAAFAIGLYGLLRLAGQRRTFLIALGTSALFYLVAWVPFALKQIDHFAAGDVSLKRDHVDLVFTTLMLAGVPFRLLAERDYQIEFTPVFSGVLFIVPWFLVRRFRPLLPWVLWLVGSAAAIFVLDVARTTVHAAGIRYLSVITPVVPLLFVGIVWPVRRWLAYGVGGVITFVGLIYLHTRNRIEFDVPAYNDVGELIAEKAAPGEPILLFDDSPSTNWRIPVLMMVVTHQPGVGPRTMLMLSKPISDELASQLKGPTAWLIVNGEKPLETAMPWATILDTYHCVETDIAGVRVAHVALDRNKASTAPSTVPTASTVPATRPAD